MKKMIVLVLIATALFYIDRQGLVFVTVLGLAVSPFMFTYWYCVFRFGGKPAGTDEVIYQEEARKQGVADDDF